MNASIHLYVTPLQLVSLQDFGVCTGFTKSSANRPNDATIHVSVPISNAAYDPNMDMFVILLNNSEEEEDQCLD